jgi:hypothetical protein
MREPETAYLQAGERSSNILTDWQFAELKKIMDSYVKVVAFGSIRQFTDEELERNARLLDAAGYTQREIGKILHRAPSSINDILAGKTSERKGKRDSV